jgi:hypothetical protein
MSEVATVDAVIRRALDAYEALATLGEDVEDEWAYMTDLSEAWRERLEAVADARGGKPAGSAAEAAVERAIDETGRIRDPHRAIDWLSTFPQVVLTSLGERP